jgi:hypothetical protein
MPRKRIATRRVYNSMIIKSMSVFSKPRLDRGYHYTISKQGLARIFYRRGYGARSPKRAFLAMRGLQL